MEFLLKTHLDHCNVPFCQQGLGKKIQFIFSNQRLASWGTSFNHQPIFFITPPPRFVNANIPRIQSSRSHILRKFTIVWRSFEQLWTLWTLTCSLGCSSIWTVSLFLFCFPYFVDDIMLWCISEDKYTAGWLKALAWMNRSIVQINIIHHKCVNWMQCWVPIKNVKYEKI